MPERSLLLTFEHPPPDAVVLRAGRAPRRLGWNRGYLLFMGAAFAIAVLSMSRILLHLPGAVYAIGGVIVAVEAVLIVLAYAESRLRRLIVTNDRMVLTAIGMRSSVRRDDVDHIIITRLATQVLSVPAVFLVSRSGRNLMRIPPTFSTERLAEVLGVPVLGSWDERSDANQLNQQVPGAIPPAAAWLSTHPVKVAAITAAFSVALVIVTVTVVLVVTLSAHN